MGVLACDRRGCNNIMCDHYSPEYGYICDECLNELKDKPYTDIGQFMDTPKEGTVEYFGDWEDVIMRTFKSRWDEGGD